ncbi:hypothetical protein PNA2_0766 [Pyrococcus sp. NA2]|uniref:TldD/PmbA family protein n=1 Tax=Pyrococcus sp. (strain NA2) TaxID=342949 RepID=UPI000209AE7F|nr:TldD/PmbA family protein [Pyrococcus sp. NA2]AEC51682.1 hypothetical protein PNA2_0766 [Pyrococcus sp. NA2]
MIENIEVLTKILDELNVEWEIYWGRASSLTIKFRKIKDKREVERGTFRVSSGIGLRVLVNGRVGFSYVSGSKFSEKDLQNLVRRAYKIAKIAGSNYPGFPQPGKYPKVRGLYDKRISSIQPESLVEIGMSLIDVEQNAEASISISEGARGIINSNGIEAEEKGTSISFGTYIFEKGKGSGEHSKTFRSLPNLEKEIDRVREIASWEFELSKNATKLNGYEGEIIFEPKALISLLSLFLPNVSAKNVYLKRSRFEKLGLMVASESFTMIDDPTIDGGIGSYSFDGEGVPGRRKYIIREGILESFLSDQKYGMLIGMESTGNAVRSYASQPEISTSNLIIPPGSEEFEEGVVVRSVYGEHTANPVTGDFSLNIELGYILRGGDVEPFKGNMIVGNVFEMLRNITGIGKEVEILDDFISPKVAMPSKII